jgi:hypothetical protein
MSLKWYPNARLDETQEAYGKTWRVDKIENDGAIVFRCGSETALAPRTDTPEQDANEIDVIEISATALRRSMSVSPVDRAIASRKAENRLRQAESADKMQKEMSEALAGVGAKLLVHDCYTCDVDMKEIDDRIKSFMRNLAPKSDLSYKALEEYLVYKGWAEKGWNGI